MPRPRPSGAAPGMLCPVPTRGQANGQVWLSVGPRKCARWWSWVDDGPMIGHGHSDRPALITTAPESLAAELGRRKRRYAIMAAIFIASFSSAALLHHDTPLALLLCGVAITMLVLAVIGANVRSPRRRSAGAVHVHAIRGQRKPRIATARGGAHERNGPVSDR